MGMSLTSTYEVGVPNSVSNHKVCRPYSIMYLNWISTFEGCVVRLDLRMDNQQAMCS